MDFLENILSYVTEFIKDKLLSVLNKDGNLNRFFDKKYKIKGTEILYDLYKKSTHFKPMEELRERKKGERLRPLAGLRKENKG